MCLGHVYIVLEPVGSARLKFGDNRYYEFLCFDVPKVVRSLGYDHGHDEESRNGRDIKIDILDDYVWTSKGFRVSPIYRSLCLDHFDTPRHVCDHIRDSELPSVHQNTKTHNTIFTEL